MERWLREDYATCRRVATHHYENFSVVSAFVPKALRPNFYALYAFCRGVDDLGDAYAGDRLAALCAWRLELARAYEGTTTQPVFRALGDTVRRFDLDRREFEKLIDANVMDQASPAYATFEDTLAYCRCSADPVGRLVLALFGYRDERRQALSDAVCTGLQLANFLQDVDRDRRNGRCYWPEADLRRFGLSSALLLDPTWEDWDSAAVAAWTAFESERIEGYFALGAGLEAMLPGPLGRQIRLYRLGGEAIVQALRAQDGNPFRHRPVVSTASKLVIMGRVLTGWGGAAGRGRP